MASVACSSVKESYNEPLEVSLDQRQYEVQGRLSQHSYIR